MKQVKSKIPRIVFFSHSSDLYGAERSLLLLLSCLETDKFDPVLVCPSNGPLPDRAERIGIRTVVVQRNTVGLIRGIINRVVYFTKLISFLLKSKPDLVYVNTIAYALPVIAAKALGIPTVVHVRESRKYFYYRHILGCLRVFPILRFPKRFICISQTTQSLLLDKGVDGATSSIVYNGIDTDAVHFSQTDRQRIRDDLGLGNRNVLVGFVGQIKPVKGVENFVLAAARVSKERECVRFVVLGDPLGTAYHEKINRMCSDLGLDGKIMFLGFKEDILPYFFAIDLFAHTSVEEPFGRVIIEAMAAERPVVTTDSGGPREIVKDGETGYIVPVDAPDSLSAKIITLVDDESLRKQFGKAGRKRVEENFSLEQYYNGVKDVLESVLGE